MYYLPHAGNNEYTELLLEPSVSTQLNGTVLESGGSYTFTLYYQKGMRSSSASTKVEVLEGAPPSVHVKAQMAMKENVDRCCFCLFILRKILISSRTLYN